MKKQAEVRRRVPARRRLSRKQTVQHWVKKHWLESGLVALVVIILGAVVLNHASPGGTSSAAGTGSADTAAPTSVLDVTARDAGNSMGPATAPVTIINYSDFMCPYCTMLANQIEPQLIHDYVDTGKVRYIVREGAFLTPASQDAAEAAACAEDQGKYWPYHDLLYKMRAQASQGIYTTDKLKSYARQLNLKTSQFDTCLDSHTHADEVKQVTQVATDGGVSGTPTVFINGQPLVGGQSYDAYRQAIDAALAQK
jgi:protein-disulfide isomerase